MDVERHDKDDIPASQDHDLPKQRLRSRIGAYLTRDVESDLTSIPIILCCICSGLVDSCVFNAWGVFAGMQTGMIYKMLCFMKQGHGLH